MEREKLRNKSKNIDFMGNLCYVTISVIFL